MSGHWQMAWLNSPGLLLGWDQRYAVISAALLVAVCLDTLCTHCSSVGAAAVVSPGLAQ
jgi:hypothetical protein